MKRNRLIFVVGALLLIALPLLWVNHRTHVVNVNRSQNASYTLQQLKPSLITKISSLDHNFAGVPRSHKAVAQLQTQFNQMDGSPDAMRKFSSLLKQKRAEMARGLKGAQKVRLDESFADLVRETDYYQSHLLLQKKYDAETQKSGLRSAFDRFYGEG